MNASEGIMREYHFRGIYKNGRDLTALFYLKSDIKAWSEAGKYFAEQCVNSSYLDALESVVLISSCKCG